MAFNNHSDAFHSAPYPDERFAPPPPPKSASYNSSSRSSPSPPYSQQPAAPPYGQPPRNGASPFDSVFDDPRDQRRYPGAGPGGVPPQAYGQDTGYYGQGGVPPNSTPYPSENIPLQDQTGKNHEINDHIYDAPSAAENGRRRKKTKGKVRLGELGMFGANKKRIPFVTYLFTTIQVVVFIAEIIRNGVLTGSPIMIKPSFNPMIGPSTQVMINMGARYVPCMHNIKDIQGSAIPITFVCPNATSLDNNKCSLSELCGLSGVPNPTFNNPDQSPAPNQWYRFITPIFMHAGLIHIGFNLLMQLTIAKEMEMAIGPIRYFLVYMSAGIFGFVLGGNFAAPLLPSTGASGALFGIIALTLLDLLYSWKERRNPVKDLMFLLLDMIISFALGLLPGLDNFAHIGGFIMGLGLGICVLHSPNALRKRMGEGTPYSAVFPGETDATTGKFFKEPIGFFKGRKPFWWLWWIIRAAVLVAVIVVFVVLLNNFYTSQRTCGWCKYLSCIPVNDWCEVGKFTTTKG